VEVDDRRVVGGPGVKRADLVALEVLEEVGGPGVEILVVDTEVEFITVEGLADSVCVTLAVDNVDEAGSVV